MFYTLLLINRPRVKQDNDDNFVYKAPSAPSPQSALEAKTNIPHKQRNYKTQEAIPKTHKQADKEQKNKGKCSPAEKMQSSQAAGSGSIKCDK